MGHICRHTLGLGERENVAWHEELDLAQAYLDVEQVRYGSRLRVEMDVDEDCADCLIPPLVLQPLIENAVKHGIAKRVQGGAIRIAASRSDGMLTLRIYNDGPALPASWGKTRNCRRWNWRWKPST